MRFLVVFAWSSPSRYFHAFFLWVVLIHIHDVCVYWLWWQSLWLVVLVFRGCLEFSWGCVTLCCRLLVIVQSLRLVVLFFEEFLELHDGMLPFLVVCLLLCIHYDWPYCFSKNVLNFAGVCYSFL